jgi:hypothetical protein
MRGRLLLWIARELKGIRKTQLLVFSGTQVSEEGFFLCRMHEKSRRRKIPSSHPEK